jgi:AcrR family transcriptional regulator
MLMTANEEGSARRFELLEAAYSYALDHGLGEMSLRPLAAATGTSPRVLLYLFGSKDELIAAILARARREQLELVSEFLALHDDVTDAFEDLIDRLWTWLAAPAQRDTIRLFFEAYIRSLHPKPGPWRDFATNSVSDWIDLLVRAQPGADAATARARATHTLATLRGLLLDLLATEDFARVDVANHMNC